MRLSNARTLKLKEFVDNIPSYATLSHCWDEEEVVFADLSNLDQAKTKKGFGKIQKKPCEQALKDDFDYVWIDACCTIQTHHRRQCPTKRVAYAAENGGRMYIAFQYKRINISILTTLSSQAPAAT